MSGLLLEFVLPLKDFSFLVFKKPLKLVEIFFIRVQFLELVHAFCELLSLSNEIFVLSFDQVLGLFLVVPALFDDSRLFFHELSPFFVLKGGVLGAIPDDDAFDLLKFSEEDVDVGGVLQWSEQFQLGLLIDEVQMFALDSFLGLNQLLLLIVQNFLHVIEIELFVNYCDFRRGFLLFEHLYFQAQERVLFRELVYSRLVNFGLNLHLSN